jgi:hypothetical protein
MTTATQNAIPQVALIFVGDKVNAYELADELLRDNTQLTVKAAYMLRQQADRIAELEKGGEVAGRFYWESVVDGHVMAVPSEGTPHYNKDDFPLYTTPQIKELSDEEIKAIANNLTCTPDKNWNVLFAKAILKKASEK